MSRQASMITINSQRYKEKQNKSICIFNYMLHMQKVHKMLNKKMLPKKKEEEEVRTCVR